jgi:hypothetical protein
MKKVGVDLGGRWLRIGIIDPINNGAIPQPDTPRNGLQSWNEFVDIILSVAHNDGEFVCSDMLSFWIVATLMHSINF